MTLMTMKKRPKITIPKKDQKVFEESQPAKSNTLIFWGVILAMSSIGLLIFVLSEKIFQLS